MFCLFGIVNIMFILIHPSVPCFPKYVPDADETVEKISGLDSRTKYVNNDCECGVRGPVESPPPEKDSDLADPQEYSWHVLIQLKSSAPKFCGGSIINDVFVIASVSCFVQFSELTIAKDLLKGTHFNAEDISIYINVKNNQPFPKGLKATSIHCHPKALPSYITTGQLDYDICILQLSEKLNFSKGALSPVCLPENSDLDLVGRRAILLGWKPGTSGSSDAEKSLGKKDSWIYSNTNCGLDNNRLLCTQHGTTKEIFQFENVGSPVMVTLNSGRLIQVGMSSWKYLVDSSGFDSIPVDISSNLGASDLISFINQHSENAKASWCKQPKTDFPAKSEGFEDSLLKSNDNPWDGFPSTYRRMKKSCQCGIRKSLRKTAAPRIVGGQEVALHEYGWQVQLLINMGRSTQGCGGSIINSKIILTASHCVANIKSDGKPESVSTRAIKVRIRKHTGFSQSSDNDKDFRSVEVAKILSHPDYYFNVKGIGNDIAILQLKEELDFESSELQNIFPICLSTTEELDKSWEGKIGTVIGYGLTDEKDQFSTSKVLRELDVPIHEHQKCVDAANLIPFGVPEKAICAGHQSYFDYKDPSHGDSGGPLMISRTDPNSSDPKLLHLVQIGVVSAGTYDLIIKPYNPINITALWYSSVPGYLSYIDFFSYRAGAVWCSW